MEYKNVRTIKTDKEKMLYGGLYYEQRWEGFKCGGGS